MSLAIFDERAIFIGAAQFLAGDGTSWKSLAAANLGDKRLDDIHLSNSGAADRTVEFRFTLASVTRHLGSVVVPAGAGYAGVAPIDAMTTIGPTAQAGFLVLNSNNLECRVTVAMGGSDILDAVCWGGTF